MRHLIGLVLSFFSLTSIIGQWNLVSNGTFYTLYSIEDNGTIVSVGGSGQTYISSDNGSTWNRKQIYYNNSSISGHVQSIHFFNSTDGFITGPFLASNDELIFETNDAGTTWTLAYSNNVGNWPRDIESFQFLTGSTGYACGTNGKVLYTNTSGSSWYLVAQINLEELNDIWFVDNTTGFVCGVNGIWKTTNSGSTWTQVYNDPGIYLNAIHFADNLNGVAVGDYGAIFKTTDGGNTWQDLSQGLSYTGNINDLEFTSPSIGYLACDGGIFKTSTGGLYWEYLPLSNKLYGIDMTSSTAGYTCGENGSIYKTGNGGGIYHPISKFKVSGKNCEDSVANYLNQGDPTLSYEWIVDGNIVSTAYNYSTSFPDGGGNHLIQLVANNGTYTDTSSVTIYLLPSLNFAMSGSIAQDSMCSNQNSNIILDTAIYHVTYWLEDGSNNQIGASQTGVNVPLTFNTNAIGSTQTYQLIGEKTIGGCGSNYDTLFFDVYNMTPLPVTTNILQNPICKGDSAKIEILNSTNNVQYYLTRQGYTISDTVIGTGSSITLTSIPLMDTSDISISAIGITGCPVTFPAVTIDVHVPLVHFTQNPIMQEVGSTINYYNTSIQPNYSYYWSFENASPSAFTGLNPPPTTYNTPGFQDAKLIAVSSLGCKDSLINTMSIIPTGTTDTCNHIIIRDNSTLTNAYYYSAIQALADYSDGSFAAYHQLHGQSIYNSITNDQDTLRITNPSTAQFADQFLIKYSPKGVPEWKAKIQVYEKSDAVIIEQGTSVTNMITDSNNNLFVAYCLVSHIEDSVKITSSDNTVSYTKGDFMNGNRAIVLSKFDSLGIHQWSNSFSGTYTITEFSLAQDSEGNTYVSSNLMFAKFSVNGTKLWERTNVDSYKAINNLRVFQDTIYVLLGDGDYLLKYDTSGTKIGNSPEVPGTGTNHKMLIDEVGNRYITGNYGGILTFANQNVSDTLIQGGVVDDIFIARFNNRGEQDWFRTIKCHEHSEIIGFDYKNGRLYVYASKGPAVLSSDGVDTINTGLNDMFFFSVDTVNQFPTLENIYSKNSQIIPESNNAITVTDQNDIILSLLYEHDFQYGGISAVYDSTRKNHIIFKGNPNCLGSGYNSNLPSAYFYADHICLGDTIFLNGSGSNNPTNFIWNSNGGHIHSTTSQNTYMTFDTAGVYQVDLTVSNANGTGGTFTRYVSVTSIPSFSLVGNDTLCFDSPNQYIQFPDASYTVWYDNDTILNNQSKLLTWANSPTNDSSFTFRNYDSYGCYKDSSIHFVVIARPEVTMTINPNSAWCSGEQLDITVTGTNVDSYLWTNYGNSTDPHLTAIANSGSDLDLTIGNQGCSLDTILYSRHEDAPYINFTTSTTSYCAGDTVIFNLSTNAASFLWSTGDTTSSLAYAPTANGTLTVTGYSPNGHCYNTASKTYTVTYPPPISYVVPPDTVCGNQSLTFQTVGTNIISTWTINRLWPNGNTNTVYNQNSITNNYLGDADILVSTQSTSGGNSCVVDTTLHLTLIPTVAATSTYNTGSCDVNLNYLKKGNNTNASAVWLFNNNYVSNADSIVIDQTGTYTIQQDSLGCTTSTDYYEPYYTQIPANILYPDGLAFCSSAYALLPLVSDTNVTCYWYRNGSYVTSNTTLNVTSSQLGEYVLEVSSPGCPNDFDTVTVFMSGTTGAINITTPQSTSICNGDSTLLISNTQGAKWYSQNNFISNNDSIYANQAGWYVSEIDTNHCITPDSVYINNPTSVSPTITLTGNDTICSYDIATLSSSETTGNNWVYNSTVFNTTNTVDVNQQGAYGLYVINNGCMSDTSWTEISVITGISPTISLIGNDTICSTDFTTLSSSESSGNNWLYNSTVINTNNTVNVNQQGAYGLYVINNGCIGDTNWTEITVFNNNLPVISLIGNDTICSTDFTTLSSSESSGNNWVYNSTVINTNNTVNVDQQGAYGLYIMNNGCISDTTWTDISVINSINPTILLVGNDTICPGDYTTLTSSESTGNNWLYNSTVFNTNDTIDVTQQGTYGLFVVNEGCIGDTNWVDISVFGDNTPIISQVSNDLTTGNYTSYQWYLDGSIIINDTSQIITPTQDGNFTVEIIDSNNCTFTSTPYLVNWTSIDEFNNIASIYPNPTSGIFNVKFSEKFNGQILIYNALGDVVSSTIINDMVETVNLKHLETGVYFISIEIGESISKFKIIKD